jgi:ribosomal silencing factor RsfS
VKKKGMSEKRIKDTAKKCAQILDEKKALDTVLIDMKKVSSYLDYFLITTGNSHIHCRSLANS